MRFLIIDPLKQEVRIVEAKEPREAHPDLHRRGVDYGGVYRGLGLYVYEYGLVDLEEPYCAINGQLYSGDVVLFAYDEAGETVDIPEVKIEPAKGAMVVTGLAQDLVINWLPTQEDVELAIAARVVGRPQVAINSAPLWSWPAKGYRP